MNKKTPNRRKFSSAFLMALCFILTFALAFNACSSASAEKKKKKTKKEDEVASVEKEKDAEEHSESAKETESSSEEKEEKKEEDKKEDEKTSEKKDADHKSDQKSDHKSDHKSDKKEGEAKEKSPSAEEVWADLMRGNKMFRQGKYSAGNLLAERVVLAKGQKPKVIILGCADSRVPPELVFGKNTGDIFVVRDAGNIVDEVSLGSMEYAVEHLHAKVIIVLGHESCGAVAATVSGEKMPTKNLQSIVDTIFPALDGSKECPIGGKMNLECVKLNVSQVAKTILAKSPIIKEASEDGLIIIKAVYKMESGEVIKLD